MADRIFMAHDLTHVEHALDDGEFLEVHLLTVDEAISAVHAGEITDGKTISALSVRCRSFQIARCDGD